MRQPLEERSGRRETSKEARRNRKAVAVEMGMGVGAGGEEEEEEEGGRGGGAAAAAAARASCLVCSRWSSTMSLTKRRKATKSLICATGPAEGQGSVGGREF